MMNTFEKTQLMGTRVRVLQILEAQKSWEPRSYRTRTYTHSLLATPVEGWVVGFRHLKEGTVSYDSEDGYTFNQNGGHRAMLVCTHPDRKPLHVPLTEHAYEVVDILGPALEKLLAEEMNRKPTVSKAQLGIMRHSVGNLPKSKDGRNHFAISPGGTDYDAIQELVTMGLMEKGRQIPGGMEYYHVTDKGYDFMGLDH